MTGQGAEPDGAVASYDARRHPAQLVRRVHQRGAQLFTQGVVQPNLSVTQFVALATLLRHGPLAQSQLAQQTSMDPSTTNAVVRKLEEEAFVVRSRSPEDRRATLISLTDAGRACAEAHVPLSLAAGEALLEPLTPIERDLFLALLRKILGDDVP